MNRTEAIKFLHKQIKEADSKKLQNLILDEKIYY